MTRRRRRRRVLAASHCSLRHSVIHSALERTQHVRRTLAVVVARARARAQDEETTSCTTRRIEEVCAICIRQMPAPMAPKNEQLVVCV